MIISKNCYKSLISNLNGNVKCLDKMHSVSGLYYNTYVPSKQKSEKKSSIFGDRIWVAYRDWYLNSIPISLNFYDLRLITFCLKLYQM